MTRKNPPWKPRNKNNIIDKIIQTIYFGRAAN